MPRKLFVAGNWKMYTSGKTARELARGIVDGLKGDTRAEVAVIPPFVWLEGVGEIVKGSPVALGAQNVYPSEKEGAFTGEIYPQMLVDAGCKYVLVGHSERRHVLKESDAFINSKVLPALKAGLHVIFCVGETLAERESGATEARLDLQLTPGIRDVPTEFLPRLVLAYEPIWAIGTGHNATPEQAQQAHVFLRQRFRDRFGEKAANEVLIQYGGSVKPENAAELMAMPDVDGALVGGASLKSDSFLGIIRACAK